MSTEAEKALKELQLKEKISDLLNNLNMGTAKVELGVIFTSLMNRVSTLEDGGGGGETSVTVDSISDATATGKAVMKASTKAAARQAIDAAAPSDIPTIPAAPNWDTLDGKPAVIAAGADQAAARNAIGAGTSNLAIGTTASTAMAGNTSIPAAAQAGSRAELDGGSDSTQRTWAAKDLSEFVSAKIAEAAGG